MTILSHRVFNTPWSLLVTSKSVDWVSNKPAFLWRYTFPSFLFRSSSLPFSSSPAALYFLLTDDACLDQHSLRETYGGKDVFIEKLLRYRSCNLTVAMGNTKRRYVKRGFSRSVQPSSSSCTLSPSLGTTRQIRIDINFVLKYIFLIFYMMRFCSCIILYSYNLAFSCISY